MSVPGGTGRSTASAGRSDRALAILQHLRSWPFILLSLLFLGSGYDQLRHTAPLVNGLRVYVWLPPGSEPYIFWLLTAAELGIGLLVLVPALRHFSVGGRARSSWC